MTTRAQTVTILFTDLVGSTELLQRAGDEQAQRIFKAHHRLLREAVEAHGGHEVKWLGDGLMVAFDSTGDAVKCAIAMQQMSRRPTAGERLEIRAGLHVGEAFVDESDYFGTSVVIARRLCDSGGAGAIRASDIVVRLLDGRSDGIRTNDLGSLDLKGITNPVPAVEIVYEHDPMALLRKLPFVGRHDEYEAMLKKLGEARNGRGSVILLAGEPGIGKTRLTEEFCDHASSGATVVRGNCYEGDVAAPFGPWTEALRSLLEQTPDPELRDSLGPGAPDIAQMMPEVRRRIPDLELAPPLEPEAERARLFDSINAWLRNSAEKKQLVIFLDDLHWCDRPSLALLEQVARGVAEKKIVVVGTYRDVEVDRVHPLAQTLAALRRMDHHERIAIRGFTQDSVYDLLNAIEPSEQAEAAKRGLAQILFTESEGNPFFLREVLNNLVETGKVVQRDGVWSPDVTSVDELGIPEGIKEVIGRRLSRLSETCNRMLQRASAMTGGFSWDELCAICDDSEDNLLDALDEALGSQLIAERERNAYAFTHALIRATLYDELSTPRRVQLHRRIAESLESLYADSIDDHLGELAAHYLASTGNAAGKAVDYSTRAGDRAMTLFAFEEAATHYQHALDASAIANDGTDEANVGLMLSLVRAQKCAGVVEAASETAKGAVAAARPISPQLFARAAVAFAEAVWQVWGKPALRDEARDTLEEALEGLGDEESAERVLALAYVTRMSGVTDDEIGTSGFSIYVGGRSERDIARAGEAVAIAERLGEPRLQAVALSNLIGCARTPALAAENRDRSREMLRLANEAADMDLQFEALWWCCETASTCGELADAQSIIDEFERRASRTRVPAHQQYGPLLRADRARCAGRFEESQTFAREALDFATKAGVGEATNRFTTQFGSTLWFQGQLHEVASVLSAQLDASPGNVSTALVLAIAHVEYGDDAAAATILAALPEPANYPRDFTHLINLSTASRICFLMRDRRLATQLQPLVDENPGLMCTWGGTMVISSTTDAPALVSTVLECWDEAERKFVEAIEQLVRIDFPVLLSRVRWEFAEMLVRRNTPGDRERANTLAQQAHDFAKKCGMAFVERKSAELLATLA